MSGILRAKLEYNGKIISFPCDRDPQIHVNDLRREFEDGSEVSTRDVVELLHFYGHDIIKTEKDRLYKNRVYFVDDDNNNILFDHNGDPIIRIVDGKICSAAHDCICDKTFPMKGGLKTGDKKAYDKFKAEVESSGIFDKGKKVRKLFGKEIEYTCKTCGNVWTLEDNTASGSYLWAVKSRLSGRG